MRSTVQIRAPRFFSLQTRPCRSVPPRQGATEVGGAAETSGAAPLKPVKKSFWGYGGVGIGGGRRRTASGVPRLQSRDPAGKLIRIQELGERVAGPRLRRERARRLDADRCPTG